RSRPVHAHPHGMSAQVPSSGEAVTAPSTNHVSFTGHNVAAVEIAHIGACLHNFAHEFVADHHGNRDGALCPFIPVINVQIRSANPCAPHLNEYIVDANRGFGNVFQPESWRSSA